MDVETFKEQCALVDNYINWYESDFMGAEKYLKEYYNKSSYIESLLGSSMCKEFPNFVINADTVDIKYHINQLLDTNKFISHYCEAAHNYICANSTTATERLQLEHVLLDFVEADRLVENVSIIKDDICINGTVIQIKEGMKVMRALRKLAEALGVNMEEFEEFRKEHAKILSTKELRGTLCLSALPMDFLTLSDNNSNWRSCYSWRKNGLYHASTLAYLNAPNTIIVYLKDDKKNYNWDSTEEWNSKIWRQLIYIDSDFIVPGRAYPYDNEQLTEKVVDYITDLLGYKAYSKVTTNLADCDDKSSITKATEECPVSLIISNNNGYNDFYGGITYWINARQQYSRYENIIFDGEVHCLNCGDVIDTIGVNRAAIVLRVCTKCRQPVFCEYCGGVIHPSEFTMAIDNEEGHYHLDCWQEKEIAEGWLEEDGDE